jgi:hypothetical protein
VDEGKYADYLLFPPKEGKRPIAFLAIAIGE